VSSFTEFVDSLLPFLHSALAPSTSSVSSALSEKFGKIATDFFRKFMSLSKNYFLRQKYFQLQPQRKNKKRFVKISFTLHSFLEIISEALWFRLSYHASRPKEC